MAAEWDLKEDGTIGESLQLQTSAL